jgi:hypothetical protein
MSATAFSFTYADLDGSEGQIDLTSMRKLWVDCDRSGIVFAEPAPDGTEVLHEVVIEGSDAIGDMTEVMDTLLGVNSFERLESPLVSGDRTPLVLEFRYPQPQPQVVALALRAS